MVADDLLGIVGLYRDGRRLRWNQGSPCAVADGFLQMGLYTDLIPETISQEGVQCLRTTFHDE